ncbi:MAG: ATP-binding protein [Methylobacter sp.]
MKKPTSVEPTVPPLKNVSKGLMIGVLLINLIVITLLYLAETVWKDGSGMSVLVAFFMLASLILAYLLNVAWKRQAAVTEVLHESESRLRTLGDNLPDSYLYEFTYQDGKPRFLYISSGVEQLHGLKVADILEDATILLKQIAPTLFPAYLEAEDISRRDMTDFSMDLQLQGTTGEWRWIRMHSHPRKRDNGQVIWDGIATDITDRHLFEVEINRLAQAIEQNPTGILITDTQGIPCFTNQAYTRITGYQFAEIYTKPLRELLPTEMTDDEFDELSTSLVIGKPWAAVLKNRHKKGQCYWEQVNLSPVYDDSGVISHYLYLCTDITESKNAEEELRRYKDHLEEQIQERTSELVLARDAAEAANRAKSVFLANMSHELRTPLNAILGFSNLMRKDDSISETQLTNLNIINRSGEHLLTLINDVLEMAKIESGRVQLENLAFDLGGMIRDVIDMMQIRAQEKGLRLLLDQSSEFPRYIEGDEARLRQVLINLVGNAVKFTKQGGITLRLGVRKNAAAHLLIEVEDTGTGIAPEDQSLIFEPFIQVGKYGVNQGSGLGLAITRQFVQLMGGILSVSSTLGKGSSFLVDIPLVVANPTEIANSEDIAKGNVLGLAANQPVYRILIVDDQQENQLLLKKLMETINFPTKTADNGAQAIELFQSWQPQLIFMDSRMPVMDGTEASRRIRQLPGGKEVKIVAVTASIFMEQRDELLKAGMDDFIRKPYRFNDIYDSLSRLLGVQYLLESMSAETAEESTILTSAMLSVLPLELRIELKDALESLDSGHITSVIAHIKPIDAKLYKTLSHLVENFNYPGILKALDER